MGEKALRRVQLAPVCGGGAPAVRRQKMKRRPKRPAVHELAEAIWRALLTVLLDTRRAQAGKAVLVDGILPGEEFLDGQRITAARLFERQ